MPGHRPARCRPFRGPRLSTSRPYSWVTAGRKNECSAEVKLQRCAPRLSAERTFPTGPCRASDLAGAPRTRLQFNATRLPGAIPERRAGFRVADHTLGTRESRRAHNAKDESNLRACADSPAAPVCAGPGSRDGVSAQSPRASASSRRRLAAAGLKPARLGREVISFGSDRGRRTRLYPVTAGADGPPLPSRGVERVRCQPSNILRTSPSGSSVIRQRLSNTIVWPRAGSNGPHCKPGWLGLPVLAKLAQAVAIFFASA